MYQNSTPDECGIFVPKGQKRVIVHRYEHRVASSSWYRVAGQYIFGVQEIMSLPVLATSYVFVQDIKGYYIRVNERMVECT